MMFLNNLKYNLKVLFKNHSLVFWTFVFPLVLATFFSMAFSGIIDREKLDAFNISVVNDVEFSQNLPYKIAIQELGDENSENHLFNVFYQSEDEAREALHNGEVEGIIKFADGKPQLIINSNGINQTVLKFVVEQIGLTPLMGEANLVDNSEEHLDYMMIEFYTLIAMSCLSGGTISLYMVSQGLANMSSKGRRVAVSPAKKTMVVFTAAVASYIVQLIGLILLFSYTVFVLKVDYGANTPLVIVLAMMGALAGLSIGMMVATLFKTNEDLKISILTSVTMGLSFLAGMMGVTMKYVVDKNVPIINLINPAAQITDGYYALYYYDSLEKFWLDFASLGIVVIVFFMISIFSLRRQKYDSL
ncbi:ABC transporter permease [Candidatus Saccharibacteria bacterium]|nr:ABC transporter permease [Candidatus Saccharibacteria bacterium]